MKYCKNCVYPNTKPQLVFDEKGVCSACINHDLKEQINWEQKEQELKTIFDEFRSKDGSNYDCIIPVSGGKDSTFQTYFIKKVCGLNPLAVNLHPLDQTEIGKKNLESLKKIGVDCIEFSPNPKVYQKLARYGLKELGDFQWPEHLGIFTVPVQIAVRYNIPLIVWGENPQLEYGKPTDIDRDTILDKEWLEKNGGFFLDKIKPEGMTKYGFSIKELRPYLYPNDEDIKKIGVRGIFLGSYIKWDLFKQLELVKTLGFTENDEVKEGTYDKWENLDVFFTVFHDYFKFLKYGFGRTTDHVSLEIRYGRMTRDEGINLIKLHEGKIPRKFFKEFLRSAEITENEFHEICDKFTNKELFLTNLNGDLVKDSDGNLTLKNEII